MCACAAGTAETARFLLHRGADVNLVSPFDSGTTALMAAIMQKHAELAKELLLAGAQPIVPGKQGIEHSAFSACLRCEMYQQLLPFMLSFYRPSANQMERLIWKFRLVPAEVRQFLHDSARERTKLAKPRRNSLELPSQTKGNPARPASACGKPRQPGAGLSCPTSPMPSCLDSLQIMGATISPLNRYYIRPKRREVVRLPKAPRPKQRRASVPVPGERPRTASCSRCDFVPQEQLKLPEDDGKKAVARSFRDRSAEGGEGKSANNRSLDTYFMYISPEKGEEVTRSPFQLQSGHLSPPTASAPTKSHSRPLTPIHRIIDLAPKSIPAHMLVRCYPHRFQDCATPQPKQTHHRAHGKAQSGKRRPPLARPRSAAISPLATPVLSKFPSPQHKSKALRPGTNSDEECEGQYLSDPKIESPLPQNPEEKRHDTRKRKRLLSPGSCKHKTGRKTLHRAKTAAAAVDNCARPRINVIHSGAAPVPQEKKAAPGAKSSVPQQPARPQSAAGSRNVKAVPSPKGSMAAEEALKKVPLIHVCLQNKSTSPELPKKTVLPKGKKPPKIVNLLKALDPATIRKTLVRNAVSPSPTIQGIRGARTAFSPKEAKPLLFIAYTSAFNRHIA